MSNIRSQSQPQSHISQEVKEHKAAPYNMTAKDEALFKKAEVFEEMKILQEEYWPYFDKFEQQNVLFFARHIAKITDLKGIYLDDSVTDAKGNSINGTAKKSNLEHLGFHIALKAIEFCLHSIAINKANNTPENKAQLIMQVKNFIIRNYILPQKAWSINQQRAYNFFTQVESKYITNSSKERLEKEITNWNEKKDGPKPTYLRPTGAGFRLCVLTYEYAVDDIAHDLYGISKVPKCVITYTPQCRTKYRTTVSNRRHGRVSNSMLTSEQRMKNILGMDTNMCKAKNIDDMDMYDLYLYEDIDVKKLQDSIDRFYSDPDNLRKTPNELGLNKLKETETPNSVELDIPSRLRKMRDIISSNGILKQYDDLFSNLHSIMTLCDLNKNWPLYKCLVRLDSNLRQSIANAYDSKFILTILDEADKLANSHSANYQNDAFKACVLSLSRHNLFYQGSQLNIESQINSRHEEYCYLIRSFLDTLPNYFSIHLSNIVFNYLFPMNVKDKNNVFHALVRISGRTENNLALYCKSGSERTDLVEISFSGNYNRVPKQFIDMLNDLSDPDIKNLVRKLSP